MQISDADFANYSHNKNALLGKTCYSLYCSCSSTLQSNA